LVCNSPSPLVAPQHTLQQTQRSLSSTFFSSVYDSAAVAQTFSVDQGAVEQRGMTSGEKLGIAVTVKGPIFHYEIAVFWT
jgi:hypothetical protein